MKRGGPLKRKTRLKAGQPPKPLKRINPKRRKERRGSEKDKAYLEWAALQPCCISGELPAQSHHVRFCGSGRVDRRIIRLAERFHLHDSGPHSIERLGKKKFELYHRISIEEEIRKLNERYDTETSHR